MYWHHEGAVLELEFTLLPLPVPPQAGMFCRPAVGMSLHHEGTPDAALTQAGTVDRLAAGISWHHEGAPPEFELTLLALPLLPLPLPPQAAIYC